MVLLIKHFHCQMQLQVIRLKEFLPGVVGFMCLHLAWNNAVDGVTRPETDNIKYK